MRKLSSEQAAIRKIEQAAYMRAWKAAHPDLILEYRRRSDAKPATKQYRRDYERRRRAADPEAYRRRSRRYYLRHREQEAARAREYRARNYQRFVDYERRYYAEHRTKELAAAKAWQAAHPENVRANVARRSARIRGSLDGRHTKEQWIDLVARYGGRCTYCGEARPLCRDHAMPVSRGGSDDISNIRPACKACNSGKHTMDEQEYRAYRIRKGLPLAELV